MFSEKFIPIPHTYENINWEFLGTSIVLTILGLGVVLSPLMFMKKLSKEKKEKGLPSF